MAVVADKSGNNPTDRKYDTYSRVNAGSPNAALTPAFAGEIVLDTTTHVLWRAEGTDNASWVQLYPEGF